MSAPSLDRRRTLWVVEMNVANHGKPKWEPTIGVDLNRSDGREQLAHWRKRNPSDSFRLRPYGPRK